MNNSLFGNAHARFVRRSAFGVRENCVEEETGSSLAAKERGEPTTGTNNGGDALKYSLNLKQQQLFYHYY